MQMKGIVHPTMKIPSLSNQEEDNSGHLGLKHGVNDAVLS